MTEKRFDLVDANLIGNNSRGITDFQENIHYNIMYDDYKIADLLNNLHEENEQLKNRVLDLEELNKIYVDFLVDKGYELSDVMKGDVE